MNYIQFGFCLPIFANPGVGLFRTPGFARVDAHAAMRLGRLAEELGYDSLWVADHLMLGKDLAILEGWTTLAALAGMTQRARLGVIHYNNAFRHPALTAKMAATLDQISNGRLIHFIDYGNRPYEYLAYGMHADDSRDERIAQMSEGLELMLALWTSDTPVSFDGRYYHAHGAVCAPKPVQQPHPPIWIGEAYQEILDVAAKYAQGWNTTPVTLDELRLRLNLLREACERAGRDVDEIEKSLEIQVLVAPDMDALRRKLQRLLDMAPVPMDEASPDTPDPELVAFALGEGEQLPDFIASGWLAGTPDQVARRVQAYADEGISHFLLWFVDLPDDSGLRLFAEQVMPGIERR
jgi:alkanesulfonate monooxygenase SsuD/methylene tetrahydromethanopterin reductase-like flavin-dependent oxidoreductase (luciferase family)